jgi:hypothetical protein
MWQILWLLSLLPDWVYHLLLILSILAIGSTYVIKFVPFISQYSLPIKVIGSLVLVFSVWMEGGIVNEAKWQARVQELEAKVAEAEKKSLETNTVIETVYVDKIRVVKEVQYANEKNIKNSSVDLDKVCKIPPQAVDILNSSAHMNEGKKK